MFGFLGFLKGKVKIQLQQFQFTPGDTIQGNLLIKLKKPVHCNEVSVQLLGTQRQTSYRNGKRSTRTTTVFEFTQPLDGEKDLVVGQETNYPFNIKIPKNLLQQPNMPDGVAGTLVRAAQMFSKSSVRVDWYINARIDIPKSTDITDSQKVNIA